MQELTMAISNSSKDILIKIDGGYRFKSFNQYNSYGSPIFKTKEECIEFISNPENFYTKEEYKIIKISDIKQLANMVIGTSFDVIDK